MSRAPILSSVSNFIKLESVSDHFDRMKGCALAHRPHVPGEVFREGLHTANLKQVSPRLNHYIHTELNELTPGTGMGDLPQLALDGLVPLQQQVQNPKNFGKDRGGY